MHEAKAPSPDEALQVARRAGLPSLRPLQERLIPLVFKTRDVAVEAPHGSGKTMGVVLPLVLGLRGAGPSTNAIILSHSVEEVGKAARAHARLARVVKDAPILVALGEEPDARREQRRLERGATLVAGTVERVIDHLRRGTLSFTDVQVVVVVEPEGEGRGDFARDVQFIFARLPDRRQTILFSRGGTAAELADLLRHPVLIEASEPQPAGHTVPDRPEPSPQRKPVTGPSGRPRLVRYTVTGTDRVLALHRILLSRDAVPALVVHSSRPDGERIAAALRPSGMRVSALTAGARAQAERSAQLSAFSRREIDVLLVAVGPGLQDVRDLTPASVVLFDLHGESARPIAGLPSTAPLIVLADAGQERELSRIQETLGVTAIDQAMPGADAVLDGIIDRMLGRMKQEDRSMLARLRARIRKRVSLFQRPFFLASLLASQVPAGLLPAAPAPEARRENAARAVGEPRPRGEPAARPEPGSRGEQRGAPPTRERARGAGGEPAGRAEQRAPRQAPPPRQAVPARGGQSYAQLFVSIGRNRRVFARDLSDHFASKLSLAPGDIGGERVFDKYSFVDILPERAEEAISKLSGSELKGRTITVNYAKKKEEKEES